MNKFEIIYKYNQPFHFEIVKYPDGQQQVILDMEYFNDHKCPVVIKCSIRNWQEMEVLLCLVSALESEDFIIDCIEFAYLFGLRSDRKFEYGSGNYVRDILSPIIKRLNEKCQWPIRYLEPHGRSKSYFTHENGTYYCTLPLEFQHMQKIAGDESAISILQNNDSCWSNKDIFPSFIKTRINGVVDGIFLQDKYREIICSNELPILIMDDLCDGGSTFIEEAKYLREENVINKDRKLNLFVYHGLFTKGIDVVLDYFDKIYMTNSYQEIEHPRVKMITVI